MVVPTQSGSSLHISLCFLPIVIGYIHSLLLQHKYLTGYSPPHPLMYSYKVRISTEVHIASVLLRLVLKVYLKMLIPYSGF